MADNLNKGHWIDAAWKKVLYAGIDDAIAFFMPGLAKDRDMSKEVEILKDEFPAFGIDTDKGMRVADLCLSVPLTGGISRKVNLFIESQHEDDKNFALRMFQTFFRMSDSFKENVTALAIFTGRAKDRDEYSYSCYGVELSFKYNTYHILSQDIEILRRDERVFAPVVLAARMMIAAKGKPASREKYAMELLKILRERDYDKKRIRFIMKFVGSVLQVKQDDIYPKVKGEFEMPWVPISQVQRELEIEDAKEEGKEAGKMEVARSMIAKGFSVDIIKECTGLDDNDILALG
jgi:predicted transposase/invertase (TIGR01784 family)